MSKADVKKKSGGNAGDKLNYGRTALIGFGFMGCMLLWSVYNSFVPVILRGKLTQVFEGTSGFAQFLSSHSWLSWVSVALIVNAIMTIDNIFGVIFQPFFGKKSDLTRSKMGKRMPYILICMPICAIFFCFVPIAATVRAVGLSILLMMSVIICFNFFMSVWRSPVVSLMPDFTPSHLQSDANAVINIMGGIGQMVGFVVGSISAAAVGILGMTELSAALKAKTNDLGEIVDAAGVPILKDGMVQYVNYTPVFVVTAVIALICIVVLFFFYKKNKQYDLSANAAEKAGAAEAKQERIKIKNLPISKAEKRSLLIMLAALFLINNATEAIIPNFTNFANTTLHVAPIYSTLMMAVFAVSLAAFGIPAGIMGRKLGRKKTIIIGLIGIVVMFAIYLAVSQILGPSPDGGVNKFTWVCLWIALVVGGAAVGCVNINTLPLVLAIGGRNYVGTFTGYYYTATMSASVTGPILCGLVIGLFNEDYNFMFLFCAIFFALGLAVITQVKHGESTDITEEDIKQARMADD
ncbi:MAG: MFS transporter [Clostridiales bacterium]|nr:MFS transporter [Clostridiales bacterium]